MTIIKEDYKESLWKISKSFQKRERKKQQYGRENEKHEKQKLIGIGKNIIKCKKNALL